MSTYEIDDACEDPRGWAIYERHNGRRVREVGNDLCDPEDATLVRGFGWVLRELNGVAARANAAETKLARLTAAAREVVRTKRELEASSYELVGAARHHHADALRRLAAILEEP